MPNYLHSPAELRKAYTNGLPGVRPDPAANEAWINDRHNKRPLFGLTAPHVMAADDEESLLYEPMMKLVPDYKRGAQGIGSCVGWGWSLAVDIRAAVEIVYEGEREHLGGRTLEASVYAFSRVEARGIKRAGRSDGSYGSAAAKAVTRFGTLHYGLDYSGDSFDTYSARREKDWGDTGVPDKYEPAAKKHRVKTTSLVTSFDEAAKAVGVAKSPVPVCSNQGFTMSRDADGFCKPRGSWAHCMCFVGVRHGRRPGLLCVNSWGSSNTGPHYPENMPQAIRVCSFWVDADVADRMLRGWKDSFAVSGYDGFPAIKPEYVHI